MTISVVGMVYRSVAYTEHLIRELYATCRPFAGASVDWLIVANDATAEVLACLERSGVPFLDYRDGKPGDYYLNRVYRAWNAGGRAASGDVLAFVNSDMLFHPHWLPRLYQWLDRTTIPCSRLIESGKMPSGRHGISRDFGRRINELDRGGFQSYADWSAVRRLEDGGLYMPCLFYRDDFAAAGGYPEGNIHQGGAGATYTPFVRSGDDHFFHHNPIMAAKRHVTVFDSLVYHIQEGEKDE